MTALFDRLVQASLEGSLLIAGVWLACRLAPALPASFRVVLWWLAALKLLVGLAGIDPIPLPILPPSVTPLKLQSQVVADGRAKARPYEDGAHLNSSVGPSFSSGITETEGRRWATGTWLIAVGALFQGHVVELAGLEQCGDGALKIAIIGGLVGRHADGSQNLGLGEARIALDQNAIHHRRHLVLGGQGRGSGEQYGRDKGARPAMHSETDGAAAGSRCAGWFRPWESR